MPLSGSGAAHFRQRCGGTIPTGKPRALDHMSIYQDLSRLGPELFERIVDTIDEAVICVDEGARIILFNPSATAMFGYSQGEVLGKPLDILLPLRFRERHFHQMAAFAAEAQTAKLMGRRGSITGLRRNGREFPAYASIARFGHQDRVVFTAVLRDASADMEAEQRLRESEYRYRSLTESVPGIVYQRVRHTDGRIEYPFISRGIKEILGLDQNDVMAQPHLLLERLHEEDRQRFQTALKVSADTLTPIDIEFRHLRPDGAVRWIHAVSRPRVRDDGAVIWDSIGFDTTDVHNATEKTILLQAKLRQAEKMEAIGRLAGGVAHEINNLLQPIIMTTELVMTELARDSSQFADLSRVIDAGNKAADIVQKILAFGRANQPGRGVLDLASLVHEAIAFIRTMLPASMTFHIEIDDLVGSVRCDKTELTQILINLATNARDAIGDKTGDVSVSLSRLNVENDMPRINAGTIRRGTYAVLTVEDTGPGMDEATIRMAFEPFFTTKTIGKGTGLGLSIIHQIVISHGGAIRIDSAPGRGTAFSIYLPIEEKDVENDLD